MAALIILTNATLGTDVERGQTTTGTDTVKLRHASTPTATGQHAPAWT